jgi:hypothetical protein
MIREFDSVVLTVDLPEHRLRKGDLGTVAMAHGDRGYEIEFMTLDGETLAVVSLDRAQVRPVARGEIASARQVAA